MFCQINASAVDILYYASMCLRSILWSGRRPGQGNIPGQRRRFL